jgi:3-methyl-2-oxobutanoate hydroxymethyltransferase
METIRVTNFLAKKERGEKLVLLTAYDYPTAFYVDAAGVDAILVGDTLGMVVLGQATTLPVTMEQMLDRTAAVARAAKRALVIGDMPFLSYQVNDDEAVRNAGRFLKEAGAHAVKLEGGHRVAPLVRRLTEAGIPVMGHLGLTPQSVHQFGGFRLQGRGRGEAEQILADAIELEAAGAFALVLELVPAELAAAITKRLRIPTIGIGAGPACDGEIQVFHDLLGLFESLKPRHAKRYAEVGQTIQRAVAQYVVDVRAGDFPTDENCFHVPELETCADGAERHRRGPARRFPRRAAGQRLPRPRRHEGRLS